MEEPENGAINDKPGRMKRKFALPRPAVRVQGGGASQRLRFTLPSLRHVMIVAAIAALVIGGWAAAMAVFFEPEKVQKQIIAEMERQLGQRIIFESTDESSSFPTPSLTLHNVATRSDPRAQVPNLITISKVVVRVRLLSLFSQTPELDVSLVNPSFKGETFKDGTHSWHSLVENKVVSSTQSQAAVRSVQLVNGAFGYSNPSINRVIEFDRINGTVSFPTDGHISVAGSINYHDEPYDVNLAYKEATDTPYQLRIGNAASGLEIAGKMQDNDFTGKFKLDSKDAGVLIESLLGKKHDNKLDEKQRFAQAAQGNLLYTVGESAQRLTLSDVTLSGPYISGTGKVSAEIQAQPVIRAELALDSLSLTPLNERHVFDELMAAPPRPKTEFMVNDVETRQILLPQGIDAILSLNSKKAQAYGINLGDVRLYAHLTDGEIEVKQASAMLPGQTQTVLVGRVEGSFDGLALKGTLDMFGQKASELVASLKMMEVKLPDAMQQFRARSNIVVTPRNARFSETIIQTSGPQFLGTLVRERNNSDDATQAQGHHVELSARVSNFDLDAFLRLQSGRNEGLPTYAESVQTLTELWKKLGTDSYQVNLSLNNVRFCDEDIAGLNGRVHFDAAGLKLEDIATRLRGTDIAGAADMRFSDAPKARPVINADLKLGEVDTSRFFDIGSEEEQQNFFRQTDANGVSIWSDKAFDFYWLKQFNGNLKLKIDLLHHGIYSLQNVDTEMQIQDDITSIKSFAATLWDGSLRSSGTLQVGMAPSLSLKLQLDAASLEQIQKFSALFSDLRGRISIAGELGSSGVNVSSLVKNARGTFAVAGRQIIIEGFDAERLVRAANAVRVASDIDKIVEFSKRGGETVIQTLTGNLNLDAGILQSPGIVIATEDARGSVKGRIGLMDWTINAAITLLLPLLDEKEPPFVRLVFSGSLDKPARDLDTQVLESFVTRAAARRILTN